VHYQSQLLPTDYAGSFVAIRCHGTHPAGGEDAREVGYAQAFGGNVADVTRLRDLSGIAFPPLAASPGRMAYLRKMAAGQGEFARSTRGSMAAHYADNERSMLHAARLAGQDSIRVPRRVTTSRNDRALLHFAGSISQASGEQQSGALRLVDTARARIIHDWISSRLPVHPSGRRIERFSQMQLVRAYAFALDGGSILLPGDIDDPYRLFECRLDAELTEVARHSVRSTRFAATPNGWVCVNEEHVIWFDHDWRTLAERAMPRGTLDWAFAVSSSGDQVAVPTLSGSDLWLISRDAGKSRRFSPHKGAARNEFATPHFSDCGTWMASRCGSDVSVTRLIDGASWAVARIQDQLHQDESYDGFVVRSRVPVGLGFVGSTLLVHQGHAVRKLELEERASRSFVSEHGRAGARRPVRAKPSMSFERLVSAARLQRREEQLRGFNSPAVQLHLKALKKKGWEHPGVRGGPELGASRVGGWPDLSQGTSWPNWQHRPMAFLAQINLAEAHLVQPSLRLPKSGLLSFFLGCGDETYEKDGDRRSRYMVDPTVGTRDGVNDGWKVIFTESTENLERRRCSESPLPELFEPCAVGFRARGLSLPDEDTVAYSLLEFEDDERDDYNELLSQLKPSDECFSEQLMGFPQLIQGTPPEMMCELAFRGLDPWRYPDQASDGYPDLANGASGWGLLLQLTSNSSAKFCWGDAGHLYFYGDRHAMEAGDFSKIWVNFEN
jgi:uncharacterized protein YwqG